jgi:hypothetical protein
MYVYIRSEPGLWTVGFYRPDGTWESESDHTDKQQAAERVAWLNGSRAELPTEADIQAALDFGKTAEQHLS